MLEKTNVKVLDKVVVRFSGDSGDGMQLAGNISPTSLLASATKCLHFPTTPPKFALHKGL